MNEFYTVDICGREEDLPVLPLPSGAKIAFFNLHGNCELTEYCGEKLAERLKDYSFDVIITAESKGLQLAHCVARNLGHKFYAVARKTQKLYMQDGISVDVQSITTAQVQKLYLSLHDVNLIKGKRVAVVDDVISTGGSLKGMSEIVKKAGGEVAVAAAVLAEGGAAQRSDITFLASIPVM